MMTTRSLSELSTGQVATICGVSPKTVSEWIDTKALVGFKLPLTRGKSEHRRVLREDLIHFLRTHNMATALRRLLPYYVVVYGLSPFDYGKLIPMLRPDTSAPRVTSAFACGDIVDRYEATSVIIGPEAGRSEAVQAREWFTARIPQVSVYCFLPEDGGEGWPEPKFSLLTDLADALNSEQPVGTLGRERRA
jgi:hypothetical protein